MTEVTQEKFLEVLANDEALNKKYVEYLAGKKDQTEIGKKTLKFAEQEGYKIKGMETVDLNALENVSGGGARTDAVTNMLGKAWDRFWNFADKCVDNIDKIMTAYDKYNTLQNKKQDNTKK